MVSFFTVKGLWEPDRLVCKSGRVDFFIRHRPIVWSRTCADWYSNLISAKWVSVLALIMGIFLISWTLFAFIWYVLAFYNGDFLPDHLRPNTNHRPCLVNVGNSFLAFFLFSLETQHTIGYGYRHVNDECKSGVILLMIQSACGALITIYVGGIVFNKLARPKQRMKLLTFSERAVVAPRDGQLCFMFKVGMIFIYMSTIYLNLKN
jgi:potassium inwardly-rectifying channel subfamily J